MKTYGNGMKATEFTKRDLAPIYKAAKNGELKVERWIMNTLYSMAEFYDYDSNCSAADDERWILKIIAADDKQELIDEYTERRFNLLGLKAQKTVNREYVA